jgi:uncharacterized RDD family membrane protein YckC
MKKYTTAPPAPQALRPEVFLSIAADNNSHELHDLTEITIPAPVQIGEFSNKNSVPDYVKKTISSIDEFPIADPISSLKNFPSLKDTVQHASFWNRLVAEITDILLVLLMITIPLLILFVKWPQGKKTVKIEIANLEYAHPSFFRKFWRSILKLTLYVIFIGSIAGYMDMKPERTGEFLLLAFMLSIPMVSFFLYFFTPRKQFLHDLLSGTLVIKSTC